MRNYVIMVICLLGIIFAMAYPYMAHGQESRDALQGQLEILVLELNIEELLTQNINLRFRMNETSIKQMQGQNIQLKQAFDISAVKIKELKDKIKELKDKITAASKGTAPALEK